MAGCSAAASSCMACGGSVGVVEVVDIGTGSVRLGVDVGGGDLKRVGYGKFVSSKTTSLVTYILPSALKHLYPLCWGDRPRLTHSVLLNCSLC